MILKPLYGGPMSNWIYLRRVRVHFPNDNRRNSVTRRSKPHPRYSTTATDLKTPILRHTKRSKRHWIRSIYVSVMNEPSCLNQDAWAIEHRVQALCTEELLFRFHELVDRRIQGALTYTEYFELERIEARLDVEDRDELDHLTDRQDSWALERRELVTSIEQLLARFEGAR
jgi:hypothetical protein